MPETKTTKKPDRPKGAKTQSRPVSDGQPTRCPACGSTERTPYSQTKKQPHGGVDAAGKPYTHVVRRWTACAACGQARVDRTYENRK